MLRVTLETVVVMVKGWRKGGKRSRSLVVRVSRAFEPLVGAMAPLDLNGRQRCLRNVSTNRTNCGGETNGARKHRMFRVVRLRARRVLVGKTWISGATETAAGYVDAFSRIHYDIYVHWMVENKY